MLALDTLFAIVVAGLVVGLGLVGWFVKRPGGPVAEQQRAAWRLIPVSSEAQAAITASLREGKEARAVLRLRRELPRRFSVAQARQFARQLADARQPTTAEESLRLLRAEHPEVADELRELAGRKEQVKAVRELRKRLPLDLVTAVRLLEAQREAG